MINKRDRELLDPIFAWLMQDEQRSLNAERIGGLMGIPPGTVRGWRDALPPVGAPALPWMLQHGGDLATHIRPWLSR